MGIWVPSGWFLIAFSILLGVSQCFRIPIKALQSTTATMVLNLSIWLRMACANSTCDLLPTGSSENSTFFNFETPFSTTWPHPFTI
ncbi:hypothetical protein QL285_029552 [Trifolium repens]|nr:hypothetical protein QL285_029552 [Trifolium repens]